MGSRGSRRRARATVLAVAYGLLIVVCVGVSIALFAQSQSVLRAAAGAAALVAVAATLLVRHQLIVERSLHGEDRAQLSQDYSRLTNARVVENAEFVDSMHRRLDKIDEQVATVVAAGDKHSEAEAPTVVDLKLRGLAAS
jgi:MFS superfamily sulfate permease-like transporter